MKTIDVASCPLSVRELLRRNGRFLALLDSFEQNRRSISLAEVEKRLR